MRGLRGPKFDQPAVLARPLPDSFIDPSAVQQFLRRNRETCREENEGKTRAILHRILISGLTAPEDLLELLDPADAPLAEVDLDVAGELLIDHILQHLHQTLELGVLRPGARRVVLDWNGSEFAHAGNSLFFHDLWSERYQMFVTFKIHVSNFYANLTSVVRFGI